MKILHVCNDFAGSKVHSSLAKSLDDKNVSQIIYCPVRNKNSLGRNQFKGNNIEFVYSYCIKSYHKLAYHIKSKSLFNDLINKINVKDVNIVHASTLFSDGIIAYKLHKQYGIPYVVAVRNTDINCFLRKLPHTWFDCIKILLNASRIFFISQSLKCRFENHFVIRPILSMIRSKFVLMPNGISEDFLNNICKYRRNENKVIYVGNFSKNKNVVRLAKAILRLRKENEFATTTLTLVGDGGNKSKDVLNIIKHHPDAFHYKGKINDSENLRNVFRDNSVFAMASLHETFGLVYLEALTQNLPVLYTKNEGIDGLFKDTVGIGVDPRSIDDITEALRKLLSDKTNYSNSFIDFSQFNWSFIAGKYLEHYKDCLKYPNIDETKMSSFKI